MSKANKTGAGGGKLPKLEVYTPYIFISALKLFALFFDIGGLETAARKGQGEERYVLHMFMFRQ